MHIAFDSAHIMINGFFLSFAVIMAFFLWGSELSEGFKCSDFWSSLKEDITQLDSLPHLCSSTGHLLFSSETAGRTDCFSDKLYSWAS